MNLAANALKFTRRRESARIEIGGAVRAGEKLYSIRDNGAVFDSRRAERLCGIFQRLHPATEFEGTGVGLSIARRTIDAPRRQHLGGGRAGSRRCVPFHSSVSSLGASRAGVT